MSLPGRITREFTVWCADPCSIWVQTSEAESVSEAGRVFRKMGWRRTRARGWLCPRCAKEAGR